MAEEGVTLRDYIEEKQHSHEHRHDLDHSAHDAVHYAEKQALQTLAALVAAQRSEDAFRNALSDQSATFMTREVADTRIAAIEDKTATIMQRNSDRLNALELAAKDFLTTAGFQRFVERQESETATDRRQRAGILIGVLVAMFGAGVSVVLAVAT